MNLKKDRNKILVSIPKILQKIKNINEDKNNNQTNLFGNTDVQELLLNFKRLLHGRKRAFNT